MEIRGESKPVHVVDVDDDEELSFCSFEGVCYALSWSNGFLGLERDEQDQVH